MDGLTAGALGVVLGLALAAIATLLVRVSERRQATPVPETTSDPRVPEGAADVLAVLRDGAIVLDASGRVVRTSAAAVAYGLVRGTNLTHAELRTLAVQVHHDGIIREAELELARGPLGQGVMLVGVRVAPIGRDLVLALVDDRTQARRVEEVRRDFVVNVSHELKTPVGGLALLAEAVEDAADDPVAVQRFANRMKIESGRLTRLVSEIVDLSRLQAADLSDPLVAVDVSQCAQEAVEHTRVVAGTRRITVKRVGSPAELHVHGDAELITTAIRNLVTNAINYSDADSPIAVVSRRRGDLVEVSVTDQGQGISTADQERVFERFYRVDAARSRATGGTGLGLSIVKHICANLGGDVVVWSRLGQGSTFTIRLPAASTGDGPSGRERRDGRPEQDRGAAGTSQGTASRPQNTPLWRPAVTSGSASVQPTHPTRDLGSAPERGVSS
ncbi:sensor histidine kinase [Ornithinimicrobium murale]|uniref:sensor histidine kinase n=1 Tax=Ornithinimicrobium murale TaxID=1050153 RepID=UPI000E0DA48F|nr:ATP-binding protein [Ornithinimicrobium murale]